MKYRCEAGYTLLEVVVVMMLISIIIFILPLKISSVYDVTLKTTIDQIVYDLRWARIQAILNNKIYNFRIYKEDDIYKIDEDYKSDYIIYTTDQNNEINVEKEGCFSSKYILYKNLSPVKIEDDYYDRINFTPYGTAKNGTIGLKTKNEKLIKITVNQLGRIRIEDE
ncbi:MAG: pilus assembly FimT family protein [Bacillota bacterium]